MIGQMSSSGTIIIFYSDKSTAEHSSLVDYLAQQINGKNCPKPILLHFPRWDPYKRTETALIFCKVAIRTHRTVPNGRCNKIGWNSFFYLQFYDPNSNFPPKLKWLFLKYQPSDDDLTKAELLQLNRTQFRCRGNFCY